jgi:cytochrome o ubiquinol oxidase subunit 2
LGQSANFSGDGFSDMNFRTLAEPDDQFQAWVAKVKADPHQLTPATYEKIAAPSQKDPVQYFSVVDPNMFASIVGKYNGGYSMTAMGKQNVAKMPGMKD